MTPSARAYKRAQPLLGTFFEISLAGASAESGQIVSDAFREAAALEKMFSIFQEESEISRFNHLELGASMATTPLFLDLLQLAEVLWQHTKGTFNPFFPENIPLHCTVFARRQNEVTKHRNVKLNLNGIAKGYIVDKISEHLATRKESGCVNAGGDIRFFGSAERRTALRLGTVDAPLFRELALSQDAIASSAPAYARATPHSQTRYNETLLKVAPDYSVSVIANSCAIADGLTKLALHGEKGDLQDCAHSFNADILIFNPHGELIFSYGV